jgi:hypothetical protein
MIPGDHDGPGDGLPTRGVRRTVLQVTLDTNALDRLKEIEEAIAGKPVELSTTTVTLREHPNAPPVGKSVSETSVWGESFYNSGAVYAAPVYETLVLGESRVGLCVLGGEETPTVFEDILRTISSGSFPPPGSRDSLSAGQRRQLRDAMILESHVRDGRDILVSNDVRGFIGTQGEKREVITHRLGTRIMTVDEFIDFARSLQLMSGPFRSSKDT